MTVVVVFVVVRLQPARYGTRVDHPICLDAIDDDGVLKGRHEETPSTSTALCPSRQHPLQVTLLSIAK
jgi:hypothetical protein